MCYCDAGDGSRMLNDGFPKQLPINIVSADIIFKAKITGQDDQQG